jgi:PilZ domain
MDLRTDQLREEVRVDSQRARRSPRIRLQVPVFLRASDASGTEFIELTRTLNISATGACITSTHVLRPDQAVLLTIPAPSSSSSSLIPSETPPIQAKVRRHETLGDQKLFGLEFLRPLD